MRHLIRDSPALDSQGHQAKEMVMADDEEDRGVWNGYEEIEIDDEMCEVCGLFPSVYQGFPKACCEEQLL